MNVYEIMQEHSGSVINCIRKGERDIATELLRNLVAKAYEEGCKAGGNEAVMWLEEVYGDGIHETDAWAEYVGDCDCHSADEEEEE
jgi:hypothetical protein